MRSTSVPPIGPPSPKVMRLIETASEMTARSELISTHAYDGCREEREERHRGNDPRVVEALHGRFKV